MAKSTDVERFLDHFGDMLEKKKNVVGFGCLPVDDTEKNWELVVYVGEKVPLKSLSLEDRIPSTLELDGVTVSTDVIEQGWVSFG